MPNFMRYPIGLESAKRSKMEITNCQNPYPGVFRDFRPVRIDPSRQVSMFAARAGSQSLIWTQI